MAHFARMVDGVVAEVIVVHNNEVPDEATGVAFCKSLYGAQTEWRQTSYNGNMRKNFAGVGFTYDAIRDAFIPPQPSPEHVLNEETCRWELPAVEP